MKQLVLLLVFVLACSLVSVAQGTPVEYKSGGETVTGYVFTPHNQPVSGRVPAIIVIHEWWGLVPWVKEEAQKFADQGYVTLAIDLYRGRAATTPDQAHELMRAVPEDRSARDLRAAFEYLHGRKDVDPSRIGAIGWCMGGGYALKLAELEPALKAFVINYGAITSDANTLKPIGAAVLGIFGAKDEGIRPDDVRSFEMAMRSLGKDIQVISYDDAGHAFENPNNKRGYNAKDAQDAYQHQTEFFAVKLKN